jgi:hypothetical protein
MPLPGVFGGRTGFRTECPPPLLKGIQGDFCPIPECSFWHLPQAAPRAFRGSLRSVAKATGYAALSVRWCQRRRRASGAPASMLAHRLPIRRLVEGRCAPAAVCSGSFLPPGYCGGKKWPVCFERKRLRRAVAYPPPPPAGVRGKKERRVSRGLSIAPVGR